MSFTIQNNSAANSILYSMQNNLNQLNNYSNQLSTGYKINSAADDAAGLSIATKMGNQITGLNQASQNAQDGVSMLQTLGGGLSSISDMLGRMRQLAVQAANGTVTQSDRAQISTELTQIQQEITRTAQTTQFNTQGMLTGLVSGGVTFQVGANKGQTIDFKFTGANMTASGKGTLSLQASLISNIGGATSVASGIKSASKLLSQIDAALSNVSSFQATVGATEDRLNFAIQNLGTASNNLSSAKSGIMDTNMAQTMTQYSQENILVQAGVSMLAQAQQTPSMVLKLLQ